MKASERNLLLQIARNPEPQKVFDLLKKGKQVESPYSEIVNAQLDMGNAPARAVERASF